jgi:acyl-CoA thioester hydrolase
MIRIAPAMHETTIRVRFDEVDQMNVVHHPRYLVYFEVARTQYLTDLGIPYRDVVATGTHLAVIEVGVRHLKPARYDEVLVVATRCTEASGARVALEYEVRRGADLLATGFTRLASIEPSGRPKRMPDLLRTAFEAAVAERK